MTRLEQIVRRLPPDKRKEVENFAEYLSAQCASPERRKLSQRWAGGLREWRDKYTALELQHKSLEWWGD